MAVFQDLEAICFCIFLLGLLLLLVLLLSINVTRGLSGLKLVQYSQTLT
jgi:hypothetical protein